MNRRCLIIEDNTVCARVLEQELRNCGMTSCSVANLENGIEKIHEDPAPDLILLDLSLEQSHTGLDFLKIRKQFSDLMQIPVIVVSGSADLNTISAAMREGANDYIIKPIQSHLLKKALEEL